MTSEFRYCYCPHYEKPPDTSCLYCAAEKRGEHIDSPKCWCFPRLESVGEDGVKVWVHHEPN